MLLLSHLGKLPKSREAFASFLTTMYSDIPLASFTFIRDEMMIGVFIHYLQFRNLAIAATPNGYTVWPTIINQEDQPAKGWLFLNVDEIPYICIEERKDTIINNHIAAIIAALNYDNI
jgi:hypothetical protein